jgi:hypothetical protein
MFHFKLIAAIVLIASSSCAQSSRTLTAPVDVSAAYVASGFMGDGEAGPKFVLMKKVTGEMPRPGGENNVYTKVTYEPGAKGWAGVYWLSPADNWGDNSGSKILGAAKITFWAIGVKGGEIVEFKTGGLKGKRFEDSFEKSLGSIALTNHWKQYSIQLKGQSLSTVLGAFAWVATAADNPNGLTFYLDAIWFE